MKLGLAMGINARAENLETMGGFSPDSVTGLQHWYKNKEGITTDGSGNVDLWTDEQGNQNLVEITAAQNPAYTSETGALTFADEDMLWTGSASTFLNGGFEAHTFFVVMDIADLSANRTHRIFGGPTYGGKFNKIDLWKNDGNGNTFAYWYGAEDASVYDNHGAVNMVGYPVAYGTKTVITIHKSAASSATIKWYNNNDVAVTNTDVDVDVDLTLYSLSSGSQSASINGNVYEVLMYNTALSVSDIASVQNHLMDKFSIS
tara:strand:+ start:2580 stop:3359 length:780 start_codon:yes stop_codon:yes gene_type:complete